MRYTLPMFIAIFALISAFGFYATINYHGVNDSDVSRSVKAYSQGNYIGIVGGK